jgi:UDP-N-acetylglucosamine 2-epimerase (non-hydrolysing)
MLERLHEMTFQVMSVVGARPNFMKIAPLEREFKKYPAIRHFSVHTGQHYDADMSDVFFQQLGLVEPERHLGVGSGGHGEMTGKIMAGIETVCLELKPDLVVVVGDVNSTIAAALTARKLLIPVAHVESGLRSFDETMPEELNRRLTDCLSNLMFVSEPAGMENLKREGMDMSRAHLVGDIMLETLEMFLPVITSMRRWEDFGLSPQSYALVTIHRPSNTDTPEALENVVDILETIPYPTIFPIHPRTRKRFQEFGLQKKIDSISRLKLVNPEPYIDFLSLLSSCAVVLSDSGSVQGEAAFFDVPCLVCRENTERPIYIEQGTCALVGRDRILVSDLLKEIGDGYYKKSSDFIRTLGKDVSKKTVKIISSYLGVYT